MYKIEGAKYQETKHLSIVEIAKLVRKEVREEFKGLRASITIDKFSMGCALNLDINFGDKKTDSLEVGRAKRRLEEIAGQYNYDDSDSMSDYSDVRFYVRTYVYHN